MHFLSLRKLATKIKGRSPDSRVFLLLPSQINPVDAEFVAVYSSGGCNGFAPFSLLIIK